MQVILEVIAGAGTGHKIVVRSGQQLTVGRTDEAD